MSKSKEQRNGTKWIQHPVNFGALGIEEYDFQDTFMCNVFMGITYAYAYEDKIRDVFAFTVNTIELINSVVDYSGTPVTIDDSMFCLMKDYIESNLSKPIKEKLLWKP